MSDSNKPPLGERAYEDIELMLYEVDKTFWPQIAQLQVSPQFGILPPPPKLPVRLRSVLQVYASVLFKREADQYPGGDQLGFWLSKLAERLTERVMGTVQRVENAGLFKLGAKLDYHGLSREDMRRAVDEFLLGLVEAYVWQNPNTLSQAGAGKTVAPIPSEGKHLEETPDKIIRQTAPARLASTVHCPSAITKMEEYISTNGIGLTDFATSAGTTDRTLRRFRKSGKVRRDILAGIAKAMGITKDELIKH